MPKSIHVKFCSCKEKNNLMALFCFNTQTYMCLYSNTLLMDNITNLLKHTVDL